MISQLLRRIVVQLSCDAASTISKQTNKNRRFLVNFFLGLELILVEEGQGEYRSGILNASSEEWDGMSI
jgi:hypothetical protein